MHSATDSPTLQCPGCRHANATHAPYCTQCGRRLPAACARCGNAVAAEANFCPTCGLPQAAAAAVRGAEQGRSPNGCSALDQQGERRQLTVMFCDMVDSTALSEQLDPEELRHVMHTYYDACTAEVQRFDGHIARYLGDGLLVYFGYPRAHEDDPARAVRAALAIQAQVPRVNRQIGAQLSGRVEGGIQLRIGIHTGLVVSTQGSNVEYDVLGSTINVAARLQNVAHPGSVVISAATLRLVQGLFVLEDLGPQALKGITEPVAAHRVLQPSGIQTRLQLAAATGLTPLVGREAEIALLVERWTQVEQRRGQVVLLEGEAGMGKSRLVNALRERLTAERHTWLECGGSPYHENSALFAVRGLVQQGFDLAPEDRVADQLAKLEAGLDVVGLQPAAVVPLLARLLALPLPDRYAPLALSPEAQRRRTLDAVADWLIRLADVQPVALLVEDLHWVDPSTLELLTQVLDRIAAAPLLALLTFRPSFEQPWFARPHLLHLALNPLTARRRRR